MADSEELIKQSFAFLGVVMQSCRRDVIGGSLSGGGEMSNLYDYHSSRMRSQYRRSPGYHRPKPRDMVERMFSSSRTVKRWMWWVLVAVALATALWVYLLMSHYRLQDWGAPVGSDRGHQPAADRILAPSRVSPSPP